MSTPAAHALRAATPDDGPAMLALLPELASFELPPGRAAEHLWHGDRDLIAAWIAGERPRSFGLVAHDEAGHLAGFAFVSLREELLSHAPSAHLEVLVVSPSARRAGLGARLCDAACDEARQRGATSISLHVFANNTRARALYARQGFDEELIRAIKPLREPDDTRAGG